MNQNERAETMDDQGHQPTGKVLKGSLVVVAVLTLGALGGVLATAGHSAAPTKQPVSVVQRADDATPTTTTVPAVTTTTVAPVVSAPPTTEAPAPVVQAQAPVAAPVSAPAAAPADTTPTTAAALPTCTADQSGWGTNGSGGYATGVDVYVDGIECVSAGQPANWVDS